MGGTWLLLIACGGGAPADGAADASGGGPATGGASGGSASGGAAAGGSASGGTGGNGSGGDASGGDSASGGAAGAGSGGSSPLPSGECGIVRRFALPGAPLGHISSDFGNGAEPALVKRVLGKFVVGPWGTSDGGAERTEWLWVSDDGADQDPYFVAIAASTLGYSANRFSFATSEDRHVTLIVGSEDGYSGGYAQGDDTTRTLTELRLLEVEFKDLFTGALAGLSLDGQRGLVVSGFGGYELATFAPDGTRVGDLQDQLDLDGTCWRHVPTAQGNALLHGVTLKEYSASGEVVLDQDVASFWDGTCPAVALTESGFGVLVLGEDATWHLHRVEHDGSTSEEAWPDIPSPPLALAVADDFNLVLGEDTLVRVIDGVSEAFDLPLSTPWARIIPAEPGKLFLDLSAQGATVREIVELGCAE